MPCTECGQLNHTAPCPQPQDGPTYRAGYEAGIRKAQELAKLHAHYYYGEECRDCKGDEAGPFCKTCDGSGVEPHRSHCIEWDSFDQAIEREIER